MNRDSSETEEPTGENDLNRRDIDSAAEHVSEEATLGTGGRLPGVAAELGRGLGGIAEGIGGLIAGLARAGLDAAGAGGRDTQGGQASVEGESAGEADREENRRDGRSSAEDDER